MIESLPRTKSNKGNRARRRKVLIPLVVALVAAVVGSAATFVFGQIGDWLDTREAHSELAGVWKSTYLKYNTAEERKNPEWVSEDVIITKRFTGFRLRSENNPDEGNYVAEAKIHDQSLLVGTWESVEVRAHKSGSFLLTVAPKGDIIYGYYTSEAQDGRQFYVPWVLAKKEQDLERAKKVLRDLSVLP